MHGHVCPHWLQVADEFFSIDQVDLLRQVISVGSLPARCDVFFTTKPALVNCEAGLKRFWSIAKC